MNWIIKPLLNDLFYESRKLFSKKKHAIFITKQYIRQIYNFLTKMKYRQWKELLAKNAIVAFTRVQYLKNTWIIIINNNFYENFILNKKKYIEKC